MTYFSEAGKSCPVDNSLDNFPSLQRLILLALSSQHTLAQIVMAIDRDKSNVHKALKKLINNGFVERAGSSYILSGRGHIVLENRALSSIDTPIERTTVSTNFGEENAVKMGCKDGSIDLIDSQKLSKWCDDDKVSQPVEAHKIAFNVLLWYVPEGWSKYLNTCCGLHLPEDHPAYPKELRRAARKFGLNNELKGWTPVDITLFNGFSFQVHPNGVVVRVPPIVAEKPSFAAQIAFKRLVSILPRIERWLKLEPTALYKQGRLNIKLISTHYALFEHEFAKWWVNVHGQAREKFLVKADDGSLLLYLDNTPKNSIETSEPVVGETVSDNVQEFFKPIVEGVFLRPDVSKARVEALESAVGSVGDMLSGKLVPVLSEFSVQMEAHIGTAVAVHHGAESLDRAAFVLERAALAQEKSSVVQAQTVQVLVEELKAERVSRGGGHGWLRYVVGGVLAVVGVFFGRGWLW